MAAETTDTSADRRTMTVLGSVGMVCLLVILSLCLMGLGALLYAHLAAPAYPPQPGPYHPYWPRPDVEQWYRPPVAALRVLPSDPRDGFFRDVRFWRWEINRRGEYRYRNLGGGDDGGGQPGEIGTLPELPSGAAASSHPPGQSSGASK